MKDLLSSSLAFVLNALLNLATGVLAARMLGPDGRGELAVIVLWPQLIAVAGIALVTDAVVHASADSSASHKRIFASAAACALLLSVPLIAIGLGLESFVYDHYRPEVAAWGRLYLLFIPLTMLATFTAAIFQGSQSFGVWNALGVSVNLAYLSFVLASLALFGAWVGGFASASLLANATTLVVAIFLLAKRGWLGWRPDPRLMRNFVVFGGPLALAHLLLILGERLDQAVISQLHGERELGLYVTALGIIGPIFNLGGLFGSLVLPKVASQPDNDSRGRVLGRYLRLAVAAASLSMLIVIACAPILVRVLFGAAFEHSAIIAQIAALAVVPHMIRRLLSQSFKAYFKTRLVFRVEMAVLAADVVILLLLVPSLGAVGAAWAFVGVNIVGAFYALALTRKALNLSPFVLLRPSHEDFRHIRQEFATLRRKGAGS